MPGLSEANRPIDWANQDLCLYHGTDEISAYAIVEGRISLAKCQRFTDFGPGFYGTTFKRQAANWARKRVRTLGHLQPVIVQLRIARSAMAILETLAFVHGDDEQAEDYWSFVWHCRSGAEDHRRPKRRKDGSKSYDVVIGPVATDWEQRMLAQKADQYGFHTATALTFLNRQAKKSIIPV